MLPVGLFKDDSVQDITGNINILSPGVGSKNGDFSSSAAFSTAGGVSYTGGNSWTSLIFEAHNSARTSNVTRGKQKGVKFIIKVL